MSVHYFTYYVLYYDSKIFVHSLYIITDSKIGLSIIPFQSATESPIPSYILIYIVFLYRVFLFMYHILLLY